MKRYWLAGIVSAVVFAALLSVRLGLFRTVSRAPAVGPVALTERDTWMNLFHGGEKIGFSHSVLKRGEAGYRLRQQLRMRLNTMGLLQDVTLVTAANLNPDLSIASFEFSMDSGRFEFKAKGTVSKGKLVVDTEGAMGGQRVEVPVPQAPHLSSVLYDAVIAAGMNPGETRAFEVFDIATLGRTPVTVRMVGKEEIRLMGAPRAATRVLVDYKGMTQTAWISEEGEVLREEGLLGMRLEKTDRINAVSGIAPRPGQDVTLLASVPLDAPIENPKALTRLALRIRGVSTEGLDLHGGRQKFSGDLLLIEKEALPEPGQSLADPREASRFLESTPFIQSGHEEIVALSRQITEGQAEPLEKVRALMAWIGKNIEKKPVASIPDALSVLKNRAGDCNEHAVLLAALARAAGVPAKVEAGLVFLEGRLFYHAWNQVQVGRWVTADALFGEIPADVTHIRLVSGEEGKQMDLLGVIGKIQVSLVKESTF